MYNHLLDTFITVVQCKSFSKAAQQLFISNTAIMKQINNLEDELGIKLLNRKSTGISLTPAGEVIYKRAIEMIQLSSRFIDEAKSKETDIQYVIRLGSSFMNPSSLFIDLWRPIAHKYPEFGFEIVSYEEANSSQKSLNNLFETKIDLVYCSYDPDSIYGSKYYYIQDTPFEIAVSNRHPLANYNILKPEDLKNYTLRIGNNSRQGDIIKKVRDYLVENYPEIIIKTIPSSYNLSTFNEADLSNEILLTLPQWNTIHPNLFNRSFDIPFHNQFGIFVNEHASEGVYKLIKILKKEKIIK